MTLDQPSDAMPETFDVFLSHNSKDKPLVRRVAKRLEEYGLTPWLDVDELRPGLPFQDGLEEAMKVTRAAAVFVGAHDLGPWQRPEIRIAVSQMVGRGLPVVPVLLRGAPDQPKIGLLLAENTWVDLRKGLSAEKIEQLVWGITGEKLKTQNKASIGPQTGQAILEGAPDLTRHFQGRQAEVAACLAALRSSRLVTVVGLPGAGKTELSLAAAREELADPATRPQRALWFSLAGVRRVEELASRLALAFEVRRFERIEDLATAIGPRRVLVLLDNAEDLIVPSRLELQEFCGALLRLCTGLRFLLSSRRGLGDVAGCDEVEVHVGRLQPPFDLEVFRSATASRLSAEELASPDLPALVRDLDGHPLSLMLVAGQAGRGMSLRTLRQRLESDGASAVLARELLDESETEPTADERLRTKRLVSSLNLSYTPLKVKNPAAAEVFLWLSLFPAGFLEDLVPSVFGERGEEEMARLLDHHLAERVRGRDTRLLLPAPVRWYARRRLAEVPTERQGVLLAATFRSLGKILRAAYLKAGGGQAPLSFGLSVREEPNLATLLPAVSDAEGAAAVADALALWIETMVLASRHTAAARLGQAAKAISGLAPGTYAEARILGALGTLYVRTARLLEAEDAYQSALPIYQQIEERRGEANTLQGLGRLANAHGDPRSAFDLFLQALAIQRSVSDLLGEGGSYIYLARTAQAANRHEKAIVLGRRAWAIYRRIGTLFNQFLAIEDLIDCFTALHDEEARRGALQIAFHLGQALPEPAIQRSVSSLRERFPDVSPATEPTESWLPEAERILESALDRYEQILATRGESPLAPLISE